MHQLTAQISGGIHSSHLAPATALGSMSSGDGYSQLRATAGQHGLRRHGADPRLGARPRPRPSTAIHPSPSMEPVDAQLRLGPPGSGGVSAAAERKYVKVSTQGSPYLRKVDLRAYGGYAELWAALFGLAGQQLDLAVAYEDEDGDFMLAGDLPWDMFVDSCKKLLICKRRLI